MPDELSPKPINPIEVNAKQLIDVLAKFPGGASCRDWLQQFELDCGLARQSFYNSLRYLRERSWVTGGGGRNEVYQLNPDAPWKPSGSTGAKVGVSEEEQTRLEYLVDTQAGEIQELRDQVESLREWANGNNHGTAIGSLLEILSSAETTVRQKLRASNAILSYKTEPRITAFVRAFLEDLCASDVPADYKIEGAEQLRRASGHTMLRPSIEKIGAVSVPRDKEAEEAARRIVAEKRRRHLEEQSIKDQERLREEWQRHGWRWPVPTEDVPPDK
jgi:hypothetical protein